MLNSFFAILGGTLYQNLNDEYNYLYDGNIKLYIELYEKILQLLKCIIIVIINILYQEISRKVVW